MNVRVFVRARDRECVRRHACTYARMQMYADIHTHTHTLESDRQAYRSPFKETEREKAMEEADAWEGRDQRSSAPQ